MVVSFNIKHIYRYPVEFVANIHFTKYPCEEEKFVKRMDTLEHRIDPIRGIDYRRRVAVCDNVIPSILRKVHILNEAIILLEECAWLNLRERCLHLKSRNLTWEKYAQMHETSTFKPCNENPQWTVFEQHGEIDIIGLGPFGRLMEVFAENFLQAGSKRVISPNIIGLVEDNAGAVYMGLLEGQYKIYCKKPLGKLETGNLKFQFADGLETTLNMKDIQKIYEIYLTTKFELKIVNN